MTTPVRPSSPRLRRRDPADRWFTVPNVLSVVRLAGVPLFLWLLLGPQYDLLAVLVLVVAGLSDWLDGKLARWLDQASRLGEILDPAADRLYVLSILVAFGIRDLLPWWLVAVLIGRDLVLLLVLPVLRHYGYGPPPVHYIGKTATLCLLYAFPLLLLADNMTGIWAQLTQPVAVAFTVWGGALYVWAAVLYLVQVGLSVRGAAGRRVG